MTSILKDPNAPDNATREIDPNDPQLDFFVSPEEIEQLKAKLEAEERAKQPTPKFSELSEQAQRDKKRAAFRQTWDASKGTRDQPVGQDTIEVIQLKADHDEDQRIIRDLRRQLGDRNDELARVKEQLAHAIGAHGKEKFIGRHQGAKIEIEVRPKTIVTFDVDCGCMKHKKPFGFQLAITQLGNGYVRATERGDGRFADSAHGGPTYVRIVGSRTLEDAPPGEVSSDPEGSS